MLITVWDIYDKDRKEFVFNHIADGYSEELTKPDSNFPKQKKVWNGSEWRKYKAQLVDGKVIRGI